MVKVNLYKCIHLFGGAAFVSLEFFFYDIILKMSYQSDRDAHYSVIYIAKEKRKENWKAPIPANLSTEYILQY